jgi:hypothetical protein
MLQYNRRISLIVSTPGGEGLDLSGLRITFEIIKSDVLQPNPATITVYNLAQDVVARIRREFTRLTLSAGYDDNFGLIFTGNIRQFQAGKMDNNTDTFLTIACGDGDQAYNFGVVNRSLAAGATAQDQIAAATAALGQHGVTAGANTAPAGQPLPRGKALFGMAAELLGQAAGNAGAVASIQDGRVQVTSPNTVLPDAPVLLSPETGLLGWPEQNPIGLKFRCLLNPRLRVHARVYIGRENIREAAIQSVYNQFLPKISSDGMYKMVLIRFVGDTRGNDWVAEVDALNMDVAAGAGAYG